LAVLRRPLTGVEFAFMCVALGWARPSQLADALCVPLRTAQSWFQHGTFAQYKEMGVRLLVLEQLAGITDISRRLELARGARDELPAFRMDGDGNWSAVESGSMASGS